MAGWKLCLNRELVKLKPTSSFLKFKATNVSVFFLFQWQPLHITIDPYLDLYWLFRKSLHSCCTLHYGVYETAGLRWVWGLTWIGVVLLLTNLNPGLYNWWLSKQCPYLFLPVCFFRALHALTLDKIIFLSSFFFVNNALTLQLVSGLNVFLPLRRTERSHLNLTDMGKVIWLLTSVQLLTSI